MSLEYLSAWDDLFEKTPGGRGVSPAGLMQAWDNFVDDCESGYGDIPDEFYFDLQIRALVEVALTDDLSRFPEFQTFKDRVDKADQRFRALLIPDVLQGRLPWWQRGVLKRAGSKYADGVREQFGIEIERMDD